MPFAKTREILQRGDRASQPAAGDVQVGTLYFVTDEYVLERSSGSTWQSYDSALPASATDNAIVRFDGTTGKLVQNSILTIADTTGTLSHSYSLDGGVQAYGWRNPNTGTGAFLFWDYGNDSSASSWRQYLFGSNYVTSGLFKQNGITLYGAATLTGGINIVSQGGSIVLSAGAAPSVAAEHLVLDTSGNLTLGTGVLTLINTGLHVLDTDASHDLIIQPNTNLTADRTLTIGTGDANRDLNFTGDIDDWAAMAHGDLTFSASGSMTWTVDSGDLSYFRYKIVNKMVFIRGAILTSTVGGSVSTGLRVSAPTGATFATNDAFTGLCVYSEDGFATQTIGQAICRVTGNLIEFKKADGSNWATSTNQHAVIFGVWAEIS